MKDLYLTESEQEILTLIWEDEGRTVRSVHDALAIKKSVKYTTTLKMMQNMTDKGVLHRDTSQKYHKYYSTSPKNETQSHFLQQFIQKFYKGNVSQLIMHALGSFKNSDQELNEVKEYLKNIEKDI